MEGLYEGTTAIRFIYDKSDYVGMSFFLDCILTDLNVEEAWNHFKSKVIRAVELYVLKSYYCDNG